LSKCPEVDRVYYGGRPSGACCFAGMHDCSSI
jgi:hypothetical protein